MNAYLHAGLEAEDRGEVVLVAGDGLVKGLGLPLGRKVERVAPAVLVEVGDQVVEGLGRAGVLLAAPAKESTAKVGCCEADPCLFSGINSTTSGERWHPADLKLTEKKLYVLLVVIVVRLLKVLDKLVRHSIEVVDVLVLKQGELLQTE